MTFIKLLHFELNALWLIFFAMTWSQDITIFIVRFETRNYITLNLR